MIKQRKFIYSILFCFCMAGAWLLTACGGGNFTGERVKNPGLYRLDTGYMAGTDSHTMALSAGDVLEVHFETRQGTVRLTVTSPDSTELYRGDGGEVTDFTLTAPQTGDYTVSVEAKRAAFTLHVRRVYLETE